MKLDSYLMAAAMDSRDWRMAIGIVIGYFNVSGDEAREIASLYDSRANYVDCSYDGFFPYVTFTLRHNGTAYFWKKDSGFSMMRTSVATNRAYINRPLYHEHPFRIS